MGTDARYGAIGCADLGAGEDELGLAARVCGRWDQQSERAVYQLRAPRGRGMMRRRDRSLSEDR